VPTQNQVKIKFLGGVLPNIRPQATLRPKNQNKSKLRRNS
jgi:hypothetical protein